MRRTVKRGIDWEKWGIYTLVGIFATVIIAALYALSGYIFMTAWNLVVSPVFNLTTLNFWQGFAAVILLSMIGGYFKRGSSKSND